MPTPRTILTLATASCVALSGCTNLKKVSDKDIDPVALPELRAIMTTAAAQPDKPVLYLIDPRRPERFEAGHLPGARHILLFEAPETGGRSPEIAEHEFIVVYGDDPGSTTARAMTKRLMSLRYDDVFWFREGVAGWLEAGLPLVTETVVGNADD